MAIPYYWVDLALERLSLSYKERLRGNNTGRARKKVNKRLYYHSRTIKKIAFFVLLLVVLAFIIYAILCVKTYIDIQNSIDAYKIIEIN